jgi:hypothetical protein
MPKLTISNLLMSAATVVTMSFAIGCGNNSKKSSPPPPPAPVPVAANCPAGQLRHPNYGCIPQGQCQANYGYYQNQCIPMTGTGTSCPGGQVPINGVGCVPQGSCPQNYGFYNNQCMAGNIATLPQNGYQYGANACPGGQIYTFYGCLPTNGCQNNQGMYGSQCVPALTIGNNGVPNGYNGYYFSNYNYYPYGYYYSPYGSGNNANYGYGYGYPRYNPYFNLYLQF